jgi:hypothetical protein
MAGLVLAVLGMMGCAHESSMAADAKLVDVAYTKVTMREQGVEKSQLRIGRRNA